MEKSRLSILGVLPFIGLGGCDIGPKGDLVTSGGIVNKGILSNAIAQAYRADTKELIKNVYTEIDGTFALDEINFQGTLYVEVRTTSQTLATCDGANGCGNFPSGLKQAGEVDKNLNGMIDFGDKYFFHDPEFKLTAFIKPATDAQSHGKFAVTPLTHLAAERITQLQVISPDEVELVNAQVAELFGLNGTDITRVLPPDITNKDAMASADKSQQLYATLNAAVASAATSTNTTVADVINTLATTFKEDNGLVGNSTDSNKVTLASLQLLANDVANVVETELSIPLDEIQQQIEQEIAEQLSQPADEIVMPPSSPVLVPDFDKDGLGDEDEPLYGTDPFNPDTDADGLIDGLEVQYGTDPLNSDTDSDGLPDGWEVFVNQGLEENDPNRMDPLVKDENKDPDNDGLSNLQEFLEGTNPFNSDTDGDGLSDFVEINTHGTSPFSADSDGDGLNDFQELNNTGTNPLNFDTDGDGLPDGWEVAFGLIPTNPAGEYGGANDNDADGLTNFEEYLLNTDPGNPDTDGDGVNDDVEDFDNDGLTNIQEVQNGLDPFFNDANLDYDFDFISNLEEVTNGSDVHVPNPVIEFISDAQIYTNSTTGDIKMEVSTDESVIVASQYDVTDLDIAGLDAGGFTDVLIHTLSNNTYELPVRDEGNPSLLLDGNSTFLDFSADGHYILFSSIATNVVSGDGGNEDLFVYDRITNTTTRMGNNTTLDNNSYNGRFLADTNKIFMESYSESFAAIDSSGYGDVFLYDINGDSAELISLNYLDTNGDNEISSLGDVSADGNRMVYTTRADNIVDAGVTDSDTLIDVYFYEKSSDTHKYVSTHKDPAEDSVGADAGWAVISDNGKAIVYQTPRDILDLNVGGAGAGFNQLFYVDVDSMLAGNPVEQYTTLITKSYDGSNNDYGDGHADGAPIKISADGMRVFYKSQAQNLTPLDTNSASLDDLFMWDRSTGQNHLVSQYVYGTISGTLNYDATPSTHTNAMGIGDFDINAEGNVVYALLDYGDEYTDAPAGCTGAFSWCLYKIKLPLFTLDSDNDGISDMVELSFTTDINNPDSDGDGLLDGQEVFDYRTSPINPNTDGDAIPDGQEITNGTDPLDPASN